MINNDVFFVKSEMDYRKNQARKSIAASRGGRTRSSWLRRIAAADKQI